MITAAELADLRADSVREMPDLITVYRHDEDILDPDTLIATPQYDLVAADLPAFIVRITTGIGIKVEQGERPLEMDDFAVHTTATHIDIRPNDLLVAVQSGDPMPIHLNVLSYSAGSTTGTRRLTCQRIGDGITLPDIMLTQPAGFGLSPFGTTSLGD